QPVIQRQGMLLTTGVYSAYQWFHNGDTIAGATTFGYTATQPGEYEVVVYDGECPGRSDKIYIPAVHIGELSLEESIRIYPNPASSQIKVQSELDLSLSLFNMEGRRVLGPVEEKTISVGHLPTGIYMITIFDQKGNFIKSERLNIKRD